MTDLFSTVALAWPILKYAFFAILLISPLLGLLGTMAVNQQMAFFSDALGHSALTGIALGMVFGVGNDLVSMLVFGVIWALLISLLKHTGSASADTVISVFSSTSLALGLLLLSNGHRFARQSTLLIGDVLTTTPADLVWLAVALAAGVALWVWMYNGLLLSAVNGPLARSRGVRTRLVEAAFVVLVAVEVMLAIHIIGVLLINAMLILPAAAGRNFARSARQHALYSVAISLLSGIIGMVISLPLGTSPGAAIVLVAALFYGLSMLWRQIVRK